MEPNVTTTGGTGIIEKAQGVIGPIVNFVNSALTSLLPGKEEYVVIGVALFLGWKYREHEYVSGGYDLWVKASLIIYLILKILGFGVKWFKL
jgi:hypothetical protein